MDYFFNDFILFAGRFHPLVVHFPIALIFFAFFLQLLSLFHRFQQYKPAMRLAWLCGALTSVLAAVMGFCLSYESGYDNDLLFWHQWLGIALAGVSSVTYLLHCGCIRLQSNFLIWILSIGAVGLTMVTGHYGGSLTHGSNYLYEYAPPQLQKMVGYTPPKSSRKTDVNELSELHIYNDIVAPIFAERCLSCHSEEKMKGGLDLSSQEGIEKGGAFGPVIEPGNADGSELIRRITLPASDEAAMPPEGKARISDERVRLLQWWINSGAPFDETIEEETLPDEARSILEAQFLASLQKSENTVPVESAAQEVIQAVRQQGFLVRALASGQPLLDVRIDPLQDGIRAENILALDAIRKQIAWLNLSGCGLSGELLQSLPDMPNLTRLNVSNNPIGDVSPFQPQSFPQLTVLNLYQTNVDDDAVDHLVRLKTLEVLYVWGTGMSDEDLRILKMALPNIEVITGTSK